MAADTRPSAPRTVRAPRRWHLAALLTFALAGCARRPCSRGGRSLRGVWDDAVRDPLVTALNKVPGERAATHAVIVDLDRLARAWTDARTSACTATSRAARAILESRAACHDLARDALATIARTLAHPTTVTIDHAPAAALAAPPAVRLRPPRRRHHPLRPRRPRARRPRRPERRR